MSKHTIYLEERIEQLKTQLYNLSIASNTPSLEFYKTMRFEIEYEIEKIEQLIAKEKKHARMMRPFIITNYVAMIATLVLFLYFYLRH
jgi:hypothetical protein